MLSWTACQLVFISCLDFLSFKMGIVAGEGEGACEMQNSVQSRQALDTSVAPPVCQALILDVETELVEWRCVLSQGQGRLPLRVLLSLIIVAVCESRYGSLMTPPLHRSFPLLAVPPSVPGSRLVSL